jgi:NADH:ubiquinone reductase (H+-translocating)
MKQIIIVGGGTAGLHVATRLGDQWGARKKQPTARVTLVDCQSAHLWKPLLHRVAAGSIDPSIHQLNYAAQARWHGFVFQQGQLIGLDRAQQTITLAPLVDSTGTELLPQRVLPYDTLILALGSTTYFFQVPGAEQYTIALDTPAQAERFRQRLIAACIRAQSSPDPAAKQVTIAIIGAGATGVELAAELRDTAQVLAAYGLHTLDPKRDIKITLIEAGSRILPALPERVAKATETLLHSINIDLLINEAVTEVNETRVTTSSGKKVEAQLKVWAAGIKAPAILRQLTDLSLNQQGKILVHPTLQTKTDARIFALGDCAACPWLGHKDKWVPPRAQAAHQQATFLIAALKRQLRGKPLGEFSYRDLGSLISLGRLHSVGSLMGGSFIGNLFIEGWLARVMYRLLYRLHIAALHGWLYMILDTCSHWLGRSIRPRIKLH